MSLSFLDQAPLYKHLTSEESGFPGDVKWNFGKFVVDLPITVAVVVAASLIECFFILPDHMRHALSAKNARSWIDAPGSHYE